MISRRLRDHPAETLFSYVLAIVLLILVIVPFAAAVFSSFKTSADFYGDAFHWIPAEWRWENYIDAWNFAEFGTFLKNSAVCAAIVTVCSTLISSFAAFGFARIHFFGRNVIFYIFILTQGIPFTVIFIPTYLLMNRLGLVNTLAGLILPLISFPMGTFLMRQTMLSIPLDYEHAAMIDGCNRFQMFFKVFLPMTNNTVVALAIFTFMGSWNNYIWPLVIVSDRSLYTLPIGLTLYTVQSSMGRRPEWSVIMAAAILSVLPIMAVYSFASRRFMEGIALSGLKA